MPTGYAALISAQALEVAFAEPSARRPSFGVGDYSRVHRLLQCANHQRCRSSSFRRVPGTVHHCWRRRAAVLEYAGYLGALLDVCDAP